MHFNNYFVEHVCPAVCVCVGRGGGGCGDYHVIIE